MNRERETVVITYTNWRGDRGQRVIVPLTIRFESTEWHPDEQWILRAIDIDKGATRDFAMKDIESWGVPQPSPQESVDHD